MISRTCATGGQRFGPFLCDTVVRAAAHRHWSTGSPGPTDAHDEPSESGVDSLLLDSDAVQILPFGQNAVHAHLGQIPFCSHSRRWFPGVGCTDRRYRQNHGDTRAGFPLRSASHGSARANRAADGLED